MIILLPLINICGGRYTRHTSSCMCCIYGRVRLQIRLLRGDVAVIQNVTSKVDYIFTGI